MSVRSKESGQSLIEVLVVLVVAVVIMVGLAIVILNGLKNAQFAQNQTKATKYAQDAIEQVTVMRDRNDQIKFNGLTQFDSLFTNFDDLCRLPDTTVKCYFTLSSTAIPPLQQNQAQFNQDLGEGGLTRQIYLENVVNPINLNDYTTKKLTVRVMWTDAVGSRESNLQTYLTKK